MKIFEESDEANWVSNRKHFVFLSGQSLDGASCGPAVCTLNPGAAAQPLKHIGSHKTAAQVYKQFFANF